ncbi:MAG: type I CRISPR-associated protein Cas7 [Deltaproteobacteria bacterium]|nr:type I CRISPR-associated protein Cas7 [Deltaproteobacteria bacterium]OPX40958.1 MAG: CRISPR-associated protein [Desulfobacteraceae bacterium 4484_190.3]
MSAIEKRAVGLLVLEVINSNPNGDPDRESDPRQRLDGRGEISPVSFKRKLRDLVENKEGPVWIELAKELELNPEEFHILESRQTELKEIRALEEEKFIKKYWDGRIFGNTELEKGREVPVKTGVVQFGMGISVAPIRIERLTTTNPPVQGDKTRGMAPLAYRIVQHGVYCMPFFINPSAAQKSGCTKKDIELMLKLIPYAYSHTASYIRPQVEIRHAWYAEHNSALGSFSDQAFIEALMPKKKENPDKPSTCWQDYLVPCDLPDSIKQKTKKFINLVQ